MSSLIQTEIPAFARNRVNLASAELGAVGLSASDEFFAPLARMLADAPAVFYPDRYDDHGKWMDGWESRRKRGPGHDHAVIRLAVPGIIYGFDVDTSHFTGNYPPAFSIEACRSEGDPNGATEWIEIQGRAALGPSNHHFFACDNGLVWTHVRLNIYPDGGVARLRVYGEPWRDWSKLAPGEEVDLASALNGGRVVAFSDAHYGALHRVLAPGRGLNMGDGWETRRRREPGNDWLIVQLGHPGIIKRIVVDTAHYKGNYPDRCSLNAADLGGPAGDLTQMIVTSSMFWPEILPQRKLSMDAVHDFGAADIAQSSGMAGRVSHIRLNIYPDGGVSRLRIFGTIR
ncbi:allantoicase [Phyllobacterium salinisoli]|uniref:Probable allantoicase n=1 Tax=Phyllobacterium salinisoli TaxID=1899321 RepID=A0A368K5K7_9HYPH|nr:allantoicase [Phyllobacterium salinisoli]RCS24667.1 allantoicase [Phyllobacterium salinisoli]